MINVSFILAGLTDWIIIDCPLSTNLSSFKRKDFLNKRNEILKVVSGYINEELNPGKRNIYVPARENYITRLLKYQKIMIFKFIFDNCQSLVSLIII